MPGRPCEHNELERSGEVYVCRKKECDAEFRVRLLQIIAPFEEPIPGGPWPVPEIKRELPCEECLKRREMGIAPSVFTAYFRLRNIIREAKRIVE